MAAASWGTWQQQVEELVACSSIMGDDIRVAWSDAGPNEEPLNPEDLLGSPPPLDAPPAGGRMLSCEVTVHVELPDSGIQLVVPVEPAAAAAAHAAQDTAWPSTSKASVSTSASAMLPAGRPVRHLPPIRVRLQLPPGYPDTAPPMLELDAMWLTAADSDVLSQALVQLFHAAGPGAPILYDWIDWLRAHTLAQLGVAATAQLVVHARPVKAAVSRAASLAHSMALRAAASVEGVAPVGGAAGVGVQAPQPAQPAPPSVPAPGITAGSSTAVGEAAGASGAAVAQPALLTSVFGAAAAAGEPSVLAAFAEGGSPRAPCAVGAAARRLLSMLSSSLVGSGSMQQAHDVADAMLRCAAAREEAVFKAQVVCCPICFDEALGARFVRLPGCTHHFCRECLSTHARTRLADGAVESILCPEPSCRQQLPPHVLRALLSGEEYERWDALLLQRTLDKMGDTVYCPKCAGVVLCDQDDGCAKCPNEGCRYVFCSRCKEAWHTGEPCVTLAERVGAMLHEEGLEGLEVVAARLQQEQEAGGGMTEELRAKLRDQVNQVKSMAVIMQTSKPCPSCKQAVTKTQGCNKVVCGYCHASMCWRCGKAITGYEHFSDRACQLYMHGNEDVFGREAVEATMALIKTAHNAAGSELGGFVARCVICGALNVKEGDDNLVRCYMCHTHFCYACWCHLPEGQHKAKQHFGKPPYKCPRFTEDL